jgi:sugar phosphate isomerase/epimerase
MIKKVGVQTFTVREHTKSLKGIKETFIMLNEMGYKRFELAYLEFSNQTLELFKAMQEEYGFEYVTCQMTLSKIKNEFDFVIDFCEQLGIKTLEVSVIPAMSFLKKEKGLLELSNELNELGEKTSTYGITLLYHHHNYELFKMGDKLGIEHLFDHTDPKLVYFVIDTYWLARSGFNPGNFIDKHQSRIKGVHLRDCEMFYKMFSFKYKDQALGLGSVDFSFLNKEYPSIEFYSVEQNTKTPFKDLKVSYDYLNNL